ncbi:uncharacterized protein ACA1_149770 [Acanthamoeba castellanii str. Neff]|uniref:Uncharacterized protein n=1 Tax=Acanthamoeba castellanii (strain ATCC 30010 / Neff) TaxID=1257118 RepID=L8HB88_ACACF|nr:uncharacterized protein ACA1_149770 [Acanthamoeba castellanii str. Neff]ELR22789.1 hypothetical protein ACA1_149770 [Acanthamoeba castellanii str. Neff]
MEVEEIKTKPHKQLVVCQYSEGNTEDQCKEAARLLALPNLELEAVNCNHRVVVWNLIEHWQWENDYKVFISLDNLNSGAFRELSANDVITVLRHYNVQSGSTLLLKCIN